MEKGNTGETLFIASSDYIYNSTDFILCKIVKSQNIRTVTGSHQCQMDIFM